MTIATIKFVGNGILKIFNLPDNMIDGSNVNVYFDEVLQAESIYIIDYNEFKIIFNEAPLNDVVVKLVVQIEASVLSIAEGVNVNVTNTEIDTRIINDSINVTMTNDNINTTLTNNNLNTTITNDSLNVIIDTTIPMDVNIDTTTTPLNVDLVDNTVKIDNTNDINTNITNSDLNVTLTDNNVIVANTTPINVAMDTTSTMPVEVKNKVLLGTDTPSLKADSWGRQKVIHDFSLFSGLFTYDIPVKMWKEMEWNGSDYIEQNTLNGSSSVKGALEFRAGLNGRRQLRSHEHFRYQSNRGHLYSTSILLPNPTANLIRRFGTILPCNGVFFELNGDGTNYSVFFVIRNHFVDTKFDITSFIPAGADLTKGNLWDFQMQWRGVGDFFIYFNQELIFQTTDLGSRTQLSVENPSLPAGFEIISTDDEPIICGCVDISSEGGKDINAKYESFTTGKALISIDSDETAILAIRMPYKILYNGDQVCYSRDAILEQITSFVKDECVTSIYGARGINVPNLEDLTWNTKNTSMIEYIVGGSGTDLNTAFSNDKSNMVDIKSVRQERDFKLEMTNPSPNISPFIITSDTYFVVVMDPDASTKGGCTIEIAEQV